MARRRRTIILTATVAAAAAMGVAMVPAFAADEVAVGLGTAGAFSVLGGTTVTNTGPTVVSAGDLGVSPGSAIIGFPPGVLVPAGAFHAADAVAAAAQADLVTAYDDAAGRTPLESNVIDLAGRNLVGGTYSGDALALNGTVTLTGDADDVFIFQAASTLITASRSTVALEGEVDACNVYWQVGSSATLGTGTTFQGTVMALESITATTGTTVDGRLLARNGAVTLDSNTIVNSDDCSEIPGPDMSETPGGPSSSPPPTPSTTVTPGPSAPSSPVVTGTPATRPTALITGSDALQPARPATPVPGRAAFTG